MSQTIQNVGPGAVYAGMPTPSSLQQILPAYVYQQYADDDNVQAFFLAYNQMAQSYLDWFNATPLAVYTLSGISGPLLDWVGVNLYGIPRPVLSTSNTIISGALSTQALNTLSLNTQNVQITGTATIADDDIYKRVMTWWLYRGDGKQMSIPWIKRRVARFLYGVGGADISYPLGAGLQPSVAIAYGSTGGALSTVALNTTALNQNKSSPSGTITITLPRSQISQTFAQFIQNGLLCLPFQGKFVVAFEGLPSSTTGLSSTGGVLYLDYSPDGYPTSPSGLTGGSLYSNGGVVCVVGPTTPSAQASTIYFGSVSAASLLALGGGNLPLTNPGVGSGLLWNNGGVVCVA